MFCIRCGTQNADNAYQCTECGEVLHVQAEPAPVGTAPNHLVWAILSTIFCCLPFGIVAIVFAAQVNGYLQSGNYDKALEYSKKAKTWCWVSAICWLIPTILYVIGVIIFITFTSM